MLVLNVQEWETKDILALKDSLLGQMSGISLELSKTITHITQGVVQVQMGALATAQNSRKTTRLIEGRGFLYGMLSISQSIVLDSLVAERVGALAQACADVMMFLEESAWLRFCQKHHGLQRHRYITKTERQVLIYIQQGFSQADMAAMLGMQAPTLKTHKQNLYRKLGAHRESQALALGEEAGLFLYCS